LIYEKVFGQAGLSPTVFYSNQGIALTALRLPLGFNKAHSLFFEATSGWLYLSFS
jgi:hypothetical protein